MTTAGVSREITHEVDECGDYSGSCVEIEKDLSTSTVEDWLDDLRSDWEATFVSDCGKHWVHVRQKIEEYLFAQWQHDEVDTKIMITKLLGELDDVGVLFCARLCHLLAPKGKKAMKNKTVVLNQLADELGIKRINLYWVWRRTGKPIVKMPVHTAQGIHDQIVVPVKWADQIRQRYKQARSLQ